MREREERTDGVAKMQRADHPTEAEAPDVGERGGREEERKRGRGGKDDEIQRSRDWGGFA